MGITQVKKTVAIIQNFGIESIFSYNAAGLVAIRNRRGIRETLINYLGERIAALRGAHNLDYPFDMSRFLRSVRLALHLAQIINQRFLSYEDKATRGFTAMSKLSFKLFCIEKYADKKHIPSNEVYKLFESKGILRMLDEDYELLHGYGFDYILCDIEKILENTQ